MAAKKLALSVSPEFGEPRDREHLPKFGVANCFEMLFDKLRQSEPRRDQTVEPEAAPRSDFWPFGNPSAESRLLLTARARRQDTGQLNLQYNFSNFEQCEEEIKAAGKSSL